MQHINNKLDNLANRVSRISWGAIIAGTITALVVVTMLNLLGLGIGLTTIDPMTESDPFNGLGTGALIWLGLSNLAALFVGGLIAGRMCGLPSNTDGGLHGFLSWALFVMASLYLVSSSVGMITNGMSNAIAGLFGDSQSDKVVVMMKDAQTKGEDDVNFSYDKIKKQAFSLINQAEKYDILPDDASENTRETVNEIERDTKQAFNELDLDASIDEFFNDLSFDLDTNGNLDITVEGDKDYLNVSELKDYLVENSELSEAEIDGLVSKWENNIETAVDKAEAYYVKAKNKAIEYSDKAADAFGKLGIAAFFMFFLGALSAFFGGATASPIQTVTEERIEEATTQTTFRK